MNNQTYRSDRMNDYPDTYVEAQETGADVPVAPLPNPGEGGPVVTPDSNSGQNGQNGTHESRTYPGNPPAKSRGGRPHSDAG